MSLHRRNEPWLRMPSFRRRSLVKNLAAEVLEPRCLLTGATGTIAVTDVAPQTEVVVVDASLWDNAGLTVQQVGNLLCVFRANTQIAVFPVLTASEIGDRNIVGRADATILQVAPWDVVRVLEANSNFVVAVTSEVDYTRLLICPPEPEAAPPDPDAEPLPGNYANQELWLAAYEDWLLDQGFLSEPEANPSSENESEADDPEPLLTDYANEDLWLEDYHQWLIAHGFLGPAESSESENALDASKTTWPQAAPSPAVLIGQGIATVGIEDREWAEFDTARSDSAFGEMADSEPEDDEGPTAETLVDNGDTNFPNVGDELELDAALSDELLASLSQTLPTATKF